MPGTKVPFNVTLPESSEEVNVVRLMALTGKRHVNTFLQSAAAACAPAAAQSNSVCGGGNRPLVTVSFTLAGPPAKCARLSKSSDSCSSVSAQALAACTQCDFPPSAVPHLAAVMRSEAPETLTGQQACGIMAVAKFYMADCLMAPLGQYLASLMERLPAPEVRILTSLTRLSAARSSSTVP